MSRRSGPDRTSGERANDSVRSRHGYDDATEADQSKGALGGGTRFLWPEPAFSVHGPDQSIGRIDAQTAFVGAGAWGIVSGPRWFRGARRPSLALWAHLSD